MLLNLHYYSRLNLLALFVVKRSHYATFKVNAARQLSKLVKIDKIISKIKESEGFWDYTIFTSKDI